MPAASGSPSSPRYARSLDDVDDVGLALEIVIEGDVC